MIIIVNELNRYIPTENVPASPSTESPCLHRGPSSNVASGKKSISVAP